jgi:rod shape determining protein RodA
MATDLQPTRSPAHVSGGQRAGLASSAAGQDSPLRRVDWLLLIATLALCALGTLLVWSATRSFDAAQGLDPQTYLKKNILNIGIGLALGMVAAAFDYRLLRAYAPILYAASCLGLLLVLSPLGETINGAHSWIPLGGGFEVQPSEFAKVALVVMLAMYLGETRDGESSPSTGDIVVSLGLAVLPMLLILLQTDLGTVVVLVALTFGMLALAGVGARWLLGLLGSAALAIFVAIEAHLLDAYQLHRLTSFLHPQLTASSTAYNAAQSRIAIGSGGVFGRGLFHGSQTNGQFVPAQQTDFIFSVAGEELGLIGAGVILVLLGIVLWRGVHIATEAGDTFGRLVAVGVVCWFAFQAFENIGMTIGIMPVTGIPLPFVSYGGTAMFANLIAVGLLESVHIRSVK